MDIKTEKQSLEKNVENLLKEFSNKTNTTISNIDFSQEKRITFISNSLNPIYSVKIKCEI